MVWNSPQTRVGMESFTEALSGLAMGWRMARYVLGRLASFISVPANNEVRYPTFVLSQELDHISSIANDPTHSKVQASFNFGSFYLNLHTCQAVKERLQLDINTKVGFPFLKRIKLLTQSVSYSSKFKIFSTLFFKLFEQDPSYHSPKCTPSPSSVSASASPS